MGVMGESEMQLRVTDMVIATTRVPVRIPASLSGQKQTTGIPLVATSGCAMPVSLLARCNADTAQRPETRRS